jgi:hypothetical protein
MKTLKESLLSDIDTTLSKGDIYVWFENIINAKTQIEFDKCCTDLKKTLDDHIGKDYDAAVAQAKKVKRGEYICISHKKDVSDMQWFIYVNYGPNNMIKVFWEPTFNCVRLRKVLRHLHDYVDTHSKGYGNGKNKFYTYVCDGYCNGLRTAIIDKYKSI